MGYLQRKELTPIVYNSGSVKLLGPIRLEAAYTSSLLHWHDRIELLVVCEGQMPGTSAGVIKPVITCHLRSICRKMHKK